MFTVYLELRAGSVVGGRFALVYISHRHTCVWHKDLKKREREFLLGFVSATFHIKSVCLSGAEAIKGLKSYHLLLLHWLILFVRLRKPLSHVFCLKFFLLLLITDLATKNSGIVSWRCKLQPQDEMSGEDSYLPSDHSSDPPNNKAPLKPREVQKQAMKYNEVSCLSWQPDFRDVKQAYIHNWMSNIIEENLREYSIRDTF